MSELSHIPNIALILEPKLSGFGLHQEAYRVLTCVRTNLPWSTTMILPGS